VAASQGVRKLRGKMICTIIAFRVSMHKRLNQTEQMRGFTFVVCKHLLYKQKDVQTSCIKETRARIHACRGPAWTVQVRGGFGARFLEVEFHVLVYISGLNSIILSLENHNHVVITDNC
jgi:hypothetical protein